jgi:hypothetical protein
MSSTTATTTANMTLSHNGLVATHAESGHVMAHFAKDEQDRYPVQIREQKCHRLLRAWEYSGDRLWDALIDFADTGVLPTLQNARNIAPYKGHAMIEIIMGLGDEIPYQLSRGTAERICLAVAEHGEDAVIQALGYVAGQSPLKMGATSKPQKGRTKATRTKAGIRKESISNVPTTTAKPASTKPLPPAPTAKPSGNPADERATWMRQIAQLNAMPQADDVKLAISELKSRIIASLTGNLVTA